MLKKFGEGLTFGAGFGISFILLWYIAAYLLYPLFVVPHLNQSLSDRLSRLDTLRSPVPVGNRGNSHMQGPPFRELSMDEQIKQADAIALAIYQKAADGRMRAIITEFLKKKPGAEVKYHVGDEDPFASYYPKPRARHGNKIIIFFTGPSDTMSLAVYGDRIPSYGDITLEQFKNKCKESSDS